MASRPSPQSKSSCLDYINKCDFIGHGFELYSQGNRCKKSFFGGILWISAHVMVLIYLANSVSKYLNHTNPNVSRESVYNYMSNPLDMVKEKQLPMFMVFTLSETIKAEDVLRRFNISFEVVMRNRTDVPKIYLPVVPCHTLSKESILFLAQNIENFMHFEEKFNANMLCVDPSSHRPILSGSTDGFVNTVYSNLIFKPCTEGRDGCIPNMDLNNWSVAMVKIDYVDKYADYSKPIRYLWNLDDVFYFSKSHEQRIRTFLKRTEIYNSRGFPYGNDMVLSYANEGNQKRLLIDRVNTNTSCQEGGLCSWYLSFVTTSTGTVDKITRNYTSFPDVLGSIGGFRSVLMILVLFIYKYSNNGSEEATLVEAVFGIKVPKAYNLGCCHCKKKIKDEESEIVGLSRGKVKEAYNCIMQVMDIGNVFRELCTVKMLGMMMIDTKQHVLAPWAVLNSHLLDMRDKESANQLPAIDALDDQYSVIERNMAKEHTLPSRLSSRQYSDISCAEEVRRNIALLNRPDADTILDGVRMLEKNIKARKDKDRDSYEDTDDPFACPTNHPVPTSSSQPDPSSHSPPMLYTPNPMISSLHHRYDSICHSTLSHPLLLPPADGQSMQNED